MNVFTIRKYKAHDNARLLISLEELLAMLPPLEISHWAFRNMYLVHPNLFGIDASSFEELSTELSLGVIVTSLEFNAFLKHDFQIYDGQIDGYQDGIREGVQPVITICCFDSTQWEVSTRSLEFAEAMINRGFIAS